MRNKKASGEHSRTIVLATIVVLCVSISAQAKYSGGTGEPNDPYLIATAEDMNAIGANPDDWDAHSLLVADINLADYTGTQFNIIGNDTAFTGTFDGNGHKVWNFTWTDTTGRNRIGLFGNVGPSGQIKNLGLENCMVIDGEIVGGLVGYNSGTITNCYSTGSVSVAVIIGGLVGLNWGGTITNCYSIGKVSGSSYSSGGLVGDNHQGTITNCYAIGSVSGGLPVGGLVGSNSGTISNSYSIGSVTGDFYVGGLVGGNDAGTISNCYATGSVSGNEKVGGLVGLNGWYDHPGYIYNCYSTGKVTGSSGIGGLVGLHIAGEIAASFWDVNTSGQTSSAGGTGLPTAQMQIESTFTDAGWDFVCETINGTDEVWTIKEAVDYPKLIWQWKDYQEWIVVGKPLCWCCPRQCHGDADNTSEYIKGKGYYYVHFKDLNLLLSGWNIKEPNDGNPYPGGPGIAWPDPNICADFDHGIEGGTKTGYFRVHFSDLNILLKYWNVKEPPDGPGIEPNCLDCP